MNFAQLDILQHHNNEKHITSYVNIITEPHERTLLTPDHEHYNLWVVCGSYIVYRAVSKLDGREYFGQTENTLEERKRTHKANSKKRGRKSMFPCEIKCYGLDGFDWEIWDYAFSLEDALAKEIYWIRKHRTNALSTEYVGRGFNNTDGGENPPSWSGKKHSPETRKKMSETRKNNPETKMRLKGRTGRKHSQESKDKMSKAKRGKPAWNKGKTGIFSPETLERLSQSHTGYKYSKQSRDRMSISRTGRKHSQESKDKMSRAQKGKVFSAETRKKMSTAGKAKKLSPEHKEKIRQASIGRISKHRKAVRRLSTNIIYLSIREASKATGVSRQTIKYHCSRKSKERDWVFICDENGYKV